MARQVQPAEITSFVKGLITEASPLTFPDQASLDEMNFVLNIDGSRQRRFGMDFEEDFEEVGAGTIGGTSEVGFSTYSWENAGGDSEATIIVVQTGFRLFFFDANSQPLSANQVGSFTFDTSTRDTVYSYAVVDGDLVVATGLGTIRTFSWDGSSISTDSFRLKIRDSFGVEETGASGISLTGSGVDIRPSLLTDRHTYNLRNQTWALPKRTRGSDGFKKSSYDPIRAFQNKADGRWPSNADAVTYNLGAWLEDSETEESFLVSECVENPPGNYRAPNGYFIIDLLNRGASRLQEVRQLYNSYDELKYPVAKLPTDYTTGGATCVEEYAGRIWYAGFSGDVVDGDSRSPRLSSYVLYSQLVEDPSDIPLCYQEGDPTSAETPDLIDTDGGFIRIDSAYGIKKLINIGSGIMVVAENGVWMITGGSDYGFSATNNMRRKISDRGAISTGSIVALDKGFIYWAEDGIYQVAPNDFGDYEATNLTQGTIQTYYDNISSVEKKSCQGIWDSYAQKVRWVYNNTLESTGPAKELVLDTRLGAFYPSEIGVIEGSSVPRVISPVEVPPFQILSSQEQVTYEGADVTYAGEDVFTVSRVVSDSGFREVAYLTVSDTSPLKFTFSYYRDTSFKDWASVDGEGVDAPAYLLTGYMSGGDFLRNKDVPYVQFYLRRTETGFYEDETGNLFPSNPSSCLVQAQWEWTNSANSNRWGRQFQAYRYRRLYSPSGASDEFDTGHEVITTRSKIRGKGKVISFLIETEPEKDLNLLGWTMIMGVGNGY